MRLIEALLFWLTFQLDSTAKAGFFEAIGQLGNFAASFRQVTYSDFFDDTKASGRIQVLRPGKLRMEYFQGEKRLLIWDGKTCYERDSIADTESRSAQSDFSDEPLVQILLYGEDIERHYLIDRVKGPSGILFRMRPREGGDYEVLLGFDETWKPVTLEVRKKDGEGTLFSFTDVIYKPTQQGNPFQIPVIKMK